MPRRRLAHGGRVLRAVVDRDRGRKRLQFIRQREDRMNYFWSVGLV